MGILARNGLKYRKHLSVIAVNDRSRSSRPEVFLEKGVLKICNKFTGEHPSYFLMYLHRYLLIGFYLYSFNDFAKIVENLSLIINQSLMHYGLTKLKTNETLCAVWYHLYNLKNVKKTHGEMLLLVTWWAEDWQLYYK